MKPSEYLMGSEWKNKSKHDVFLVRIEYNKMNNFDKRFIDREELKDKINKILNKFAKTTDVDGRKTLYKYTDCDLADLKTEILELIDK